MLAIMAATVLALFALLGDGLVVRWIDAPFAITDRAGNERAVPTAVLCSIGYKPVLLMPRAGLPLDILAHELAHAYDCMDNGLTDSSPILRPAQRPTWTSDYCWGVPSEWFACSVQRYGIHALDLRSGNTDDLEVRQLALP